MMWQFDWQTALKVDCGALCLCLCLGEQKRDLEPRMDGCCWDIGAQGIWAAFANETQDKRGDALGMFSCTGFG
jgi:hypothetical protein